MLRKTKILSLLAFTLAFAGCERDVTELDSIAASAPTSQGTAINFLAEVGSRTASETEFTSGDKISVYAFDEAGTEKFTGVGYTYGSSAAFEPTVAETYIYYTEDVPALSFVAIAPESYTLSDDKISVAGVSDQSTLAGYESADIMVAQAALTSEDAPTLSFSHVMSKIILKVTKTDGTFSNETARINALYAACTVDLSGDEIVIDIEENEANRPSYFTNMYSSTSVTRSESDTKYFLAVVPAQAFGADINQSIFVYDGTNTFSFYVTKEINLEAGKSYTIEAEITGSTITFITANVNSSWNGTDIPAAYSEPATADLSDCSVDVSASKTSSSEFSKQGFYLSTEDVVSLTSSEGKFIEATDVSNTISASITDLEPETTYYIFSYGITSDNTLVTSASTEFTTLAEPTPATISSILTSDVGSDTITVSATIEDDGNATSLSVGFKYRKTGAEESVEWTDITSTFESDNVTFKATLSGLDANTSYDIYAYAIPAHHEDDAAFTGVSETRAVWTEDDSAATAILLSDIASWSEEEITEYAALSKWDIYVTESSMSSALTVKSRAEDDTTGSDDGTTDDSTTGDTLTSDDFAGLFSMLQNTAFENSSIAISFPDLTSVPGYAFDATTNSNTIYGVKSLSFPEATSLGVYAIRGLSTLTEVSAPKATEVYGQALASCSALTSVTLTAVETLYGGSNFAGSTNISMINSTTPGEAYFPELTTVAEGNVFGGSSANSVTGIKKLYLPKFTTTGVTATTSIFGGNSAFALTVLEAPMFANLTYAAQFVSYRTALVEVDLSAAKEIPASMFNACSSLSTAKIGSAQTIGASAFYGCTSLSNLTLATITAETSLGSSAFGYCSSLKSFDFGGAITALPTNILLGCSSIETVTGLESVTEIGATAFSGCTLLQEVSAPKVTVIGSSAFAACLGLSEATFSSYVSIGYRAFNLNNNTSSLTEIKYSDYAPDEIPDEIYIGAQAFIGCEQLVTFHHPTATVIFEGVFQNTTLLEEIILPKVKTMVARQSVGGALTTIYMPELISIMGVSGFTTGSSNTAVTMPANLSKVQIGTPADGTTQVEGIGTSTIIATFLPQQATIITNYNTNGLVAKSVDETYTVTVPYYSAAAAYTSSTNSYTAATASGLTNDYDSITRVINTSGYAPNADGNVDETVDYSEYLIDISGYSLTSSKKQVFE